MSHFVFKALVVGSLLTGLTGCLSTTDAPSPGASHPRHVSDIAMTPSSVIKLKQTLIFGQGDSWVGRVVYEASEDPQYVWQFLQREMPKFGWTQISAMQSKVSTLVFRRGGRVVTVLLTPQLFAGTIVQFDVSPENVGGSDFSGGVKFSFPSSDHRSSDHGGQDTSVESSPLKPLPLAPVPSF